MDATKNDLLMVRGLRLHFQTQKGVVQAVDGVDFDLARNKATVVIGESGCGKSSLAKAILRLLPRNASTYDGEVWLRDENIMELNDENFRKEVRWKKISMVPQAAMNALNPVMRIGDQVAEPAMVHLGLNKKDALVQALRMFEQVGVPADFLHRYAFELSGGMRQRAALAMSLVTLPDLVILDEPTSALDVLTQANIMNLMKRVKQELDTSFILITHDIATSSELADDVAVMYAGQIVEVSDARRFFTSPLHPYSQKLMASVPRLRETIEPDFITGQPPSLLNPPTGCRFADRCQARFDKCDEEPPTVVREDGRKVKCWLYV
ncbi:MAG: ABC transporter ATP-binding protein [Chloroflexi bacterium]|nr:ABC transporter ATP-binding protein [Chloroflexota bacterium]MBK6709934.1 ABC transporter ATP-binding protein [Chloroflexota bacterium]MBK7178764.1 ABC transporter ATP-binding protein [Chloroflexota bacterium]MBK8932558.1 ABC transporter ATP-binding protein [Chloroflexota bacterium]MBP7591150.1 ABC transporter ATP-binding protein [Chloroflexota bacterium]